MKEVYCMSGAVTFDRDWAALAGGPVGRSRRRSRNEGTTMSTATAANNTSDRATAKLVSPRPDALKHLRRVLDRGLEIKALRIRNGDELDVARGHKLEWVQDVTDLLNQMFDNPSVADYVNDWVGKVFPEYAEFGNFVEQFYEE